MVPKKVVRARWANRYFGVIGIARVYAQVTETVVAEADSFTINIVGSCGLNGSVDALGSVLYLDITPISELPFGAEDVLVVWSINPGVMCILVCELMPFRVNSGYPIDLLCHNIEVLEWLW